MELYRHTCISSSSTTTSSNSTLPAQGTSVRMDSPSPVCPGEVCQHGPGLGIARGRGLGEKGHRNDIIDKLITVAAILMDCDPYPNTLADSYCTHSMHLFTSRVSYSFFCFVTFVQHAVLLTARHPAIHVTARHPAIMCCTACCLQPCSVGVEPWCIARTI